MEISARALEKRGVHRIFVEEFVSTFGEGAYPVDEEMLYHLSWAGGLCWFVREFFSRNLYEKYDPIEKRICRKFEDEIKPLWEIYLKDIEPIKRDYEYEDLPLEAILSYMDKTKPHRDKYQAHQDEAHRCLRRKLAQVLFKMII